tara:strand:+ start:360 stop:575 length:216 start_codon:yes stop_codon:yes gene_type:complete
MATPVAQELLDIKAQVRKQDFKWTADQRERYDYLTLLRKEQIKKWKEDGRVWVGPSNAGQPKEEENETIDG